MSRSKRRESIDASIIDDVIAYIQKLEANGVVADHVKINPVLLTPYRVERTVKALESMGIRVEID